MKYFQILLIILNFNISISAYSQRIVGVNSLNESDIKVHITDNPKTADLNVYLISNHAEARKFNDGIWSYTTFRNTADIRIYYTDQSNKADIVVFLVKHKNQAGWVNQKKKQKLNFLR